MKQRNILIVLSLILAAAAYRITNNMELHWQNLAPIGSIGLFAGAMMSNKRLAFLLPLLSLFISDLCFQLFTNTPGFYGISQFFVYGAMALVTLLGTYMRQPNVVKVAGFAVAGSLVFFFVSNFGVWVEQAASAAPMAGYTADLKGLAHTIVAGIPFYKGTLLGDLAFSGLLFGSYALLHRPEHKLATA